MAPISTSPSRRGGNPRPNPEEGSKAADLKGTEGKASLFQSFNPYHNAGADDIPDEEEDYKHAGLKPAFPKDLVYEPYEPIHGVRDRGLFADRSKASLLKACSDVTDLTVNIGTELHGVDVLSLSPAQKDELALLVAERGVVVLRNQKLTGEQLRDWGRYFGPPERPLHQHPSSGVPKQRGLDELHVVWHEETMRPSEASYSRTDIWHSDVTYEVNPPGITGLYNILNPANGGGDTLFSSCYGLYDAFSPEMQTYLSSLSAVHSGLEQAEGAAAAGVHLRRPGIKTVHPLVRTNPVTGWKSIFVNPAFTREIVGVPKSESDAVLRMLYEMMIVNSDLTLRVKWQEGTLVLWANDSTVHSATYDHWTPDRSCRRHAIRFAATGEIPSLYLPDGTEGRSRREALWEVNGWPVEALRERRKQKANGGFKD
ncbi:TauD-domain-containing protein [Tilletiaria anomala UBC 951]|uniref:TauD-domain-containing protein n=1 Tax=Tilletiaria anomala (strain ATCC 24038 / CBS 436.72 / UBC 951) TaxID=1037660 RepID=A0A066WE51_TILAU|nr:TauD-domain-containing protein [Tilletiaria anomala UBC 951]KDN52046.1 TauD-domain-containing protein [Tilletiaria anomala UBC 951]